MKITNFLSHPAMTIITLPMAIMLWQIGGSEIGWGMTTDYCAAAFTIWTILVLLCLVKIPVLKIIFVLAAIFFAFLGTFTLITYRPIASWPTMVHLTEFIIGYGYLWGTFINKNK